MDNGQSFDNNIAVWPDTISTSPRRSDTDEATMTGERCLSPSKGLDFISFCISFSKYRIHWTHLSFGLTCPSSVFVITHSFSCCIACFGIIAVKHDVPSLWAKASLCSCNPGDSGIDLYYHAGCVQCRIFGFFIKKSFTKEESRRRKRPVLLIFGF